MSQFQSSSTSTGSTEDQFTSNIDVSVVIPVKDGLPYIHDCLESMLRQDLKKNWEICVYNDGSTDDTEECVMSFKQKFLDREVQLLYNKSSTSGGVGYAKNRACSLAKGRFLCFSDADDVSSPSRLSALLEESSKIKAGKSIFLGSCFHRIPEDSTGRYTRWANGLKDDELTKRIYTSHGPTLIAPTWFISRALFLELGGFNEEHQRGYPEDLDFFYRAANLDSVEFSKIENDLVGYRYHDGCASLGVSESSIWDMRMELLRTKVLSNWKSFTIWNAGKQGKRFFRNLTNDDKEKVFEFCDVDEKKIARGLFEEYDETERRVTHRKRIVHVKHARAPVVICVKLDMTGGDLERLIDESGWRESRDYVLFS